MPNLLNNRYQIIRALGSGGFGQTFLAEDTHMPSRRRCVIKQLKPVTTSPQNHRLVQDRFQREAAILERLGDANHQIPDLYAYFEEGGQFHLVQEFIEGQTLTQKVETAGKMSDRAVRDILESILPVLDYVHSQGIIHRDIKPDNIIMRQRDGKPVLIDFGAVKETMVAGANPHHSPDSIVIGTPGYMPSEQAAGRPVFSSDLYGLGLTAIYLLSSKMPQELQVDSRTGEFIWHQQASNVNPNLAAVLDRAIRSHPDDRYATASEMLNALQSPAAPVAPAAGLSQMETIAVTPGKGYNQPVGVAPSIRSQGWKKSAAIAGGIVGASLLVGLAFAFATKPRQTSSPAVVAPPTTRQTPLPSASTSPSPEVPSALPSERAIPSPSPEVPLALPSETIPSPSPEVPSALPSETIPSPSPSVLASPPTPVASEIPSPQPTLKQTEENPSPNVPTSTPIPAFPVGTPQSTVTQALGAPTKVSKGVWGNTRAVRYENYVADRVSLGYLFDRDSGFLRQTEIAFAQSVELPVMIETLDKILGPNSSGVIKRGLRRVYQRQIDRYSFATDTLKGTIERQKSGDRIYIGIWDADLH